MMKVFVFNPEHDMALADNKPSFLPPKHIQKMISDMSVLPVWFSCSGDIVVVDSVADAVSFCSEMNDKGIEVGNGVNFVSFAEPFDKVCERLSVDAENMEFVPWGVDNHIIRKLMKWGVPSTLLPSESEVNSIRELSSRHTAVSILPKLVGEIGGLSCGESYIIKGVDEVETYLRKYNDVILKAPWSSSGKGLRLCRDGSMTASTAGWINKTIVQQGSCILEPLYNKVLDFAMEFTIYNKVYFIGYSMFDTLMQGTYQGNQLFTDTEIEDRVCSVLGIERNKLLEVQRILMNELNTVLTGKYSGNFGVDMMVCKGESGNWLHPCVEINLRNNMGILAHELKNRWFPASTSFEICYKDDDKSNANLRFLPLIPEHSENDFFVRIH